MWSRSGSLTEDIGALMTQVDSWRAMPTNNSPLAIVLANVWDHGNDLQKAEALAIMEIMKEREYTP
jgi:hypothetical protein